jgi:HIRAN domain
LGLFSRKAKLSEANVSEDWIATRVWADWRPPHNIVAGESQYQAALRKACGMTGMPRRQGYLRAVCVDLTREPSNQYDRNAIAATVDGELVGYLRRHIAAQVAPALDKHKIRTVQVCGVIRGGSRKGDMLGCHLWIDRRPVEGPALSMADQTHVVSWPPFDGEGED